MKFRKTMPISEETDSRKNKKSGRLGHRRVTIPVSIREYLEVSGKDFVEWEVDTTKKTLRGKLIRGEKKKKKIIKKQLMKGGLDKDGN